MGESLTKLQLSVEQHVTVRFPLSETVVPLLMHEFEHPNWYVIKPDEFFFNTFEKKKIIVNINEDRVYSKNTWQKLEIEHVSNIKPPNIWLT